MTKYSIKNICLGIGIGLVVASMANISTASRTMTVEEIRREAAKHNLLVMDAKDMIQKQPKEESQEPAKQQTEPEQAPPVQAAEPKPDITVQVRSGATSESIAEQLLSNKLVKSKQEFLDRLREMKRESKIQIGTFKIPAEAPLDEVIRIITTSPN